MSQYINKVQAEILKIIVVTANETLAKKHNMTKSAVIAAVIEINETKITHQFQTLLRKGVLAADAAVQQLIKVTK